MDATAQAKLVEQHLDLSRRAAAFVYPRVKEHVDFDELVAMANEGLVEAASRYDSTRGASFQTFAWYRVHGAIIDAIRKNTHLPRRVWRKLVALRAASEYLEHKVERDAGATKAGAKPPEGVAALAAIKDAIAAIRTVYVTSLEAMREDKGFDAAADTPSPADGLDAQRFAKKLRAALDTLPERERALVTKHYWEGKNLLEAGAELGISKSWASRLHAQAVERLKSAISDSA